MIRFFADIIYLFFFLTLTAPLYPLFEHWNKSGKSHKRSSIAQRMILKSFKLFFQKLYCFFYKLI